MLKYVQNRISVRCNIEFVGFLFRLGHCSASWNSNIKTYKQLNNINMKIRLTKLSAENAHGAFIRTVSMDVYIVMLYILKRIPPTLYALFRLYAFSNQFSLIKVAKLLYHATINKHVVLR